MKKSLLLVLTALTVSLGAMASHPKLPLPLPQKQTATPKSADVKLTPNALGETISDYESITDWKSIGQLRYTDIFCALSDGDPSAYATYKVDAEESEGNPGLYRIKNPASSNPNASGTADTSQDYWLVIDATDPDNVTIPKQKYGYTSNGSEIYVQSWSAGTVDNENHWITFPAWGMVYYYGSDGGAQSANNPNETLWKLCLPGSKDYTFDVSQESLCPSNGKFSVAVEVGEDITNATYVFGKYNSLDEAETALDAGGTTLESGTLSFDDEAGDGKYYFVAKGLDADGVEQGTGELMFISRENANSLQWDSIGEAVITENFIGRVFTGGFGPNTNVVPIEECKDTPGFYRIANPYLYSANSTLAYYATYYVDHYGHYIYIHAENPESVTLDEGPVGLDLGYGEIGLIQVANTATLVDGVITFPAGSLGVWMCDYSLTRYWKTNSDFIVELPREHIVTVKSEDTQYGTVSIVDPATEGTSITTTSGMVTVKATPVGDAAFLNWTDAEGNVVSTDATYTYVGTSDYELTAHFGLTVNYAFPENGTMTVTVGGNTVTSGTVYAVGTTVDVKVTPADGYILESLTIAGEPVEPDENGNYSFRLTKSTEIVATFAKQTYQSTLTMVASGNGRIEAWTSMDDATDAPAGEQVFSGQTLNVVDGYGLWFWFIPGEGETVESASYTQGGVKTDLVAENDYWVSTNNAEYAQKGVCLWVFEEFAGGDVTLEVKFSGESQGIEEIGIDPANGPVEYYNLQGIRVAADNLTPGFYIVRQGSKVAKILVTK